MAHYLVGDIQGCNAALGRLLEKIDFSPSRDTLYVLGDLVNRGPDSLATLERLIAFGNSAKCLLGNHDLNLLAIACGVRKAHRKDTLNPILESPKLDAFIHWLKHQKMAMRQALLRLWLHSIPLRHHQVVWITLQHSPIPSDHGVMKLFVNSSINTKF